MRVLVVEDEEIVGKVLKHRFEKIGASVEIVTLWRDALARLSQNPKPQIVSLDLVLPDCQLSHPQQIAEVRKHAPDSLLLVVSGFAESASKEDGPKADAYIDKRQDGISFYDVVMQQVASRKGFEDDLPIIQETVRRMTK